MSGVAITNLLQRLSERDMSILESLRTYRLLTTAMIRRLHFGEGHASIGAAAGATMRVLTRLHDPQHDLQLVARLERRIGGVRAGSSGIVWQLTSRGDRLLRTMHGETKRRRYQPPSTAFTAHTLAVAELAIQVRELAQAGAIETVSLNIERASWRSFVGPHGSREWLKPDLHIVTATANYEDHWFLEADLASEHPPVVTRKAQVYQRYAATGTYQARHGLFPAVVWVVPDTARQEAITAALAAERGLQPGLFRAITTDQFQLLISGDATGDAPADDPTNHTH